MPLPISRFEFGFGFVSGFLDFFKDFVEKLFDCLNTVYIYLNVDLLSDLISIFGHLLSEWPEQTVLIIKSLLHHLMPIYLVKINNLENGTDRIDSERSITQIQKDYYEVLTSSSLSSIIFTLMNLIWVKNLPNLEESSLTRSDY